MHIPTVVELIKLIKPMADELAASGHCYSRWDDVLTDMLVTRHEWDGDLSDINAAILALGIDPAAVVNSSNP